MRQQKSHLLTVSHDPDTDQPEAIGRIVSFNDRHTIFESPDNWLAIETECETCGGDGFATKDDAGKPGWEREGCKPCEGYGCTTSVHDDVLTVLSYYEHGLCRWMVGGSTVPDRGGFDTVQVAGVIVWSGDDDERSWWDARTGDERRKILDEIANEFTMWTNGETYGFTLEGQSTCSECNHVVSGDEVDSLSGIIVTDYLIEVICETLEGYGIDASDVEVAGGVIESRDLMPAT